MASQDDRATSRADPLRRCDQCRKPQGDKECQKAAWPIHKFACLTYSESNTDNGLRPLRNAEVHRFGFQTIDEVPRVLKDFMVSHSWALHAYTRAELLLRGGPGHMHNPPKILEIRLKCLCSSGYSAVTNPALTFKFLNTRWWTVEEYTSDPDRARSWQNFAPTLEVAHKRGGGGEHFFGMLPVVYTVEDVHSLHVINLYAQHHPIPALFSDHDEESRRRLLTNGLALCVGSINLGIPLRDTEARRVPELLPGRFVRSKGRWVWEPLFTGWDQYLDGPRGTAAVDDMLSTVTTRLSNSLHNPTYSAVGTSPLYARTGTVSPTL
ncbi:uncharacterized protein TRAVEDRAFT_75050 [Trametes versicolor FP-101664 SS1]|uniref:uncharacterized protein n=1 Tax=Trametes versicolor (strain FP-101664) TaxID=717944 RepID=UPI0004624692|nr:uncharacterized protein TRAVEDRAFT_75050 [Trametes versicolor FP-101664 SS1]EIW52734.1 hypothetical protein TRAVEDRAFT_75050 [Trametes versicolor FP-101664 SS1]